MLIPNESSADDFGIFVALGDVDSAHQVALFGRFRVRAPTCGNGVYRKPRSAPGVMSSDDEKAARHTPFPNKRTSSGPERRCSGTVTGHHLPLPQLAGSGSMSLDCAKSDGRINAITPDTLAASRDADN
jgi:hypothetical protein